MIRTGLLISGRVMICVFVWLVGAGSARSGPVCAAFRHISPDPVSYDLNGVAVAADVVVVVGDHGTVLVAPEHQSGFEWAMVSKRTEANLYDVAYADGWFIAVGDAGTILLSESGITWEPVVTHAEVALNSVAGNDQLIVAVGDDGLILTSANRRQWTVSPSPSSFDLEAVTWDGRDFIVVGEAGAILQSRDGINWTRYESATDGRFASVACNGLQCVAMTHATYILSRDDEGEWTVRGNGSWLGHIANVEWCGDRFVAVGKDGDQGGSFDGVEWWPTGTGLESSSMNDVVFAGGRLLAVGDGGQIRGSFDMAESWQLANAVADVPLRGAAHGDGVSVVVGGNFAWFGAGHILSSENRTSWDLQFYHGLESVYDVAFGAHRFVALRYVQELAGGWGLMVTDDGRSWFNLGPVGEGRAPSFVYDLEFAGGQFLLAGSNATIGMSRDGSSWRFISMEDRRFGDFYGITSDGARIVAVGLTTYGGIRGVMATSDGGAELAPVDLGEIGTLSSVEWGGGRFVAVGKNGLILTSMDGVSWTHAPSPTQRSLYTVRWLHDSFVVVGELGALLTSPDGLTWSDSESGTDSHLYDILGSSRDFLIVGSDGLLLHSRCTGQADGPESPL